MMEMSRLAYQSQNGNGIRKNGQTSKDELVSKSVKQSNEKDQGEDGKRMNGNGFIHIVENLDVGHAEDKDNSSNYAR